ncbi:hypothetical protein [Neorhizobium sp. DT-125]|uniref:hypothetical protein n=1 Tax=Neorhizobium sp. DT-125 TaxID=3396163 RepID=UPI003F1B1B6E
MSLAYYTRNAASGERARRRMQRAGVNMKGHKLWDDDERRILIEHRGDYRTMCKMLPHRSLAAIYGQCSTLGIRHKKHIWSAAEISKLRRIYRNGRPEDICAEFPHSPWINIRKVATYHGLSRARNKPYKLTGIPALDEVRRRCFEIRWTMVDLDKAARTGTYFYRAGWIGKRINHRALGRAIEALDGIVQAQWND